MKTVQEQIDELNKCHEEKIAKLKSLLVIQEWFVEHYEDAIITDINEFEAYGVAKIYLEPMDSMSDAIDNAYGFEPVPMVLIKDSSTSFRPYTAEIKNGESIQPIICKVLGASYRNTVLGDAIQLEFFLESPHGFVRCVRPVTGSGIKIDYNCTPRSKRFSHVRCVDYRSWFTDFIKWATGSDQILNKFTLYNP
jgi:hypothetical protein